MYMWFCTVCVFRHPVGLAAQLPPMRRITAGSVPLCPELCDIGAGRAVEPMMVVSLYLCSSDKLPDKCNLRQKKNSSKDGSWPHLLRKHWCSAHFLFHSLFNPWLWAIGCYCMAMLSVYLPSSVEHAWKHSHRPAQKCVSKVIPNPVRLIMRMSMKTCSSTVLYHVAQQTNTRACMYMHIYTCVHIHAQTHVHAHTRALILVVTSHFCLRKWGWLLPLKQISSAASSCFLK